MDKLTKKEYKTVSDDNDMMLFYIATGLVNNDYEWKKHLLFDRCFYTNDVTGCKVSIDETCVKVYVESVDMTYVYNYKEYPNTSRQLEDFWWKLYFDVGNGKKDYMDLMKSNTVLADLWKEILYAPKIKPVIPADAGL